jgi:hypothetical protein
MFIVMNGYVVTPYACDLGHMNGQPASLHKMDACRRCSCQHYVLEVEG